MSSDPTHRIRSARQELFEFARDEIGPCLPSDVHNRCEALLTQMLVDAVRSETMSDAGIDHHERQNQP